MELFKKEGSKFYWYDFKLPGVPRQRGSTKQTNEKRAQKFASLKLAEAMEGRFPLVRRKVPTLAEQWDTFKESQLYKPKDADTRRYYSNGWRLVENSKLAKMRVSEIRIADVTDLLIPGSASNVNNARRTVRRLLNVAVESGILAKCPRIPLLEENERKVLLDDASEEALMPHAAQPLKDVIVLIRDCGMRNGREIYPMKIENIDWQGKRYFVPDSKSPAGRREVSLSDRALEVLRARCEGRTYGWVFPSIRKGKHITGGLVNKQWVRARKAAGLPQCLVLYCGRHDCGTTLMEETGDLKLVMISLGHKDLKATIRYTQPRPSRMRDVINSRRKKTGKKKAAVIQFRAQSMAQR